MKRKLCEIGIILLFYLVQVSLGRVIRIGGIMPNFMIILPVLFGYLKGRKEGIFVGFCAGILYDLFFSDLLGFSALIFVIIGYISGMFYNNYEENSFVVPLIITAISTFSYEFLIYIGNFLLQGRLITPFFVARIILPEMVYTVLLVLALYKPVQILNRHLDSKKRKVKDSDETYS